MQNEIEYKNLVKKVDSKKIDVIKKGLNIEDLKYQKRKVKKYFDCIWISRCDEWKKPESFIDLAKKFENNKFLMISYPSSGKELYYQKILNEISKTKNITFYDFLPNEKIYEILLKTKIFCITSDMEGDWPMVVLEAAFVGLPILSLHINYEGLINQYKGGIFCNSNIESFYKNFHILVNNHNLRKKMSRNVKRYIIENHNISKNVKKLVQIFENMR